MAIFWVHWVRKSYGADSDSDFVSLCNLGMKLGMPLAYQDFTWRDVFSVRQF